MDITTSSTAAYIELHFWNNVAGTVSDTWVDYMGIKIQEKIETNNDGQNGVNDAVSYIE
jgi:hypothetical protein